MRGKFGSIQFPAVRYFGYLISRCILARHNTSNITGPDLAILSAAIDNNASYNIGALIARHLSTNNIRGPIYGGIFASIMLSFARMSVREDDILMNVSRLNLAAMKSHLFVTHDFTLENLKYRLLFAFNLGNPHFVRLPAPVLFDSIARGGHYFPEGVLDEYLAALVPEEEPQDLRWQPQAGANWDLPPQW